VKKSKDTMVRFMKEKTFRLFTNLLHDRIERRPDDLTAGHIGCLRFLNHQILKSNLASSQILSIL